MTGVEGRPQLAVAGAGWKNMTQLIQLRSLAVIGQIVTILIVHFGMGIELPLPLMLIAPAALIGVNLASSLVRERWVDVTNTQLFLALLCDVAALTWLLYLSGGASNPFVYLFLLQIVLGAVLLETWSTCVIVLVTSLCFALLTFSYRPLQLPPRHAGDFFSLYLQGSLVCFALVAVLLVMFVTRINRNLRARDAHLADIRQQAAEEDHIVRMGLLASGAAHELGTPLASLSVILSDWRRMPALSSNPELLQEIEEMQAEVQRCKSIVTDILMSAGEVRGEAPVVTTVRTFLDDVIADWRAAHASVPVDYQDQFGEDMPIVSDSVLKQVISHVLDNAADASPTWIGVSARRQEKMLVVEISDAGPGFPPEMLANFGKPYQSSKGRAGRGLGLFLLVNVMRKLGGSVRARNRAEGGAAITLILPLAAIAYSRKPGNGH